MNLANIKLPIAVIGIIVAQAFGIIWYVATLDSTVTQLQATVEEVRLNTAETSVAVIQNDIANIKTNLEKIEQSSKISNESFDDTEIWDAINSIHKKPKAFNDDELWTAIENILVTLEGISSANGGVTSKELKEATQTITTKLQNVLDGKGATWNKSALKARIDALEKAIEDKHPPKKNKKTK